MTVYPVWFNLRRLSGGLNQCTNVSLLPNSLGMGQGIATAIKSSAAGSAIATETFDVCAVVFSVSK